MSRRTWFTVVAAVTLALAGTVPAMATPTAPPQVTAVNFAGTVALSNCSGSVIRLATSAPTDPALVLSNGHCLESGFLRPGQVVVNRASTRSFTLLGATANNVGQLRATKIAYATMTNTDVSIYQLNTTYSQIKQRFGIDALELVATHPTAGRPITVVSGFWKATYACDLDGFAFELHEADWVWRDSIRFTRECETIGGTSGSPIVDDATGKVIGVNNTRNEDGARCSLNNPCEVDRNSIVTVRPDIGYGQETYLIAACVDPGSRIDLTNPGCTLPRPARTPAV